MGRKKPHEEHENLERWLVSYADFITLLFATFVVLYALAQVDIESYESLQDSIRKAFAAPSVLQGSDGVMSGSTGLSLNPSASSSDSFVPPIMEYLSAKYEQRSFEDIKKKVEKMGKDGEVEGVTAEIDERGLNIKLKDSDLFFRSGEAKLKPNTYAFLDKIAELIKKKFSRHLIRIEGHTDNVPIRSAVFPSNWELSAARACAVARYFIERNEFNPQLIAAIGYGEHKPVAPNTIEENRRKNRRVEIIVLKNKFAKTEPQGTDKIKPEAEEEKERAKREEQKKQMKKGVSAAVEKLVGESKDAENQNVIIIRDKYQSDRAKALKKLQEMEKRIEDRKVKSVIPSKGNGHGHH